MDQKLQLKNLKNQILQKNILFICLDGASSKILERMLEQHELPFLARLINEGCLFTSTSFVPVSSPVIWTSIATGKVSDKHGITNFYQTSAHVRAKRIWEIFNDLGYAIGVMGHFVTWPPKKVNGFVIPDLLALDSRTYPEKYGFMWQVTNDGKSAKRIPPRTLLKYAMQSVLNGISLPTMVRSGIQLLKDRFFSSSFMESVYNTRVIKTRFHEDLFTHLYKSYKPKYASIHIHLLDVCSHRYWKYMEPKSFKDVPENEIKQHKDKIFNAYRFADHVIERIANVVPSDALIVIASDHGFKASSDTDNWRGNVIIEIDKFSRLLGLEEELNFSIIVPRIHCSLKQRSKERIDHYVELISNVETVEDGKPLFEVRRVDPDNFVFYFNKEIKEISGRHIRVADGTFPVERFLIESESLTSGTHDEKDAILILNGPGVKQCGKVSRSTSILNVVPTILALCNMPIGKDMDGQPITEAIENDFLKKYPIRYIDTYEEERRTPEGQTSPEEDEIIKKHLRSLGYL